MLRCNPLDVLATMEACLELLDAAGATLAAARLSYAMDALRDEQCPAMPGEAACARPTLSEALAAI